MKKILCNMLISTVFILSSIISFDAPNDNMQEKLYQEYLRQEGINDDGKIKNVIIFIGDGMGPNHVSAGGVYLDHPLAFADEDNKNWSYHAYSNTDSLTSEGFTLDTSRSLIHPEINETLYDGTPNPYGDKPLGVDGNITTYTDSAAGGTAIATGIKVTNGRIGIDINGNSQENLVEIASGIGKKTGVVTTDVLTGATPASFLSHAGARYETESILDSIIETSPADLIIAKNQTEFSVSYESKFANAGFHNIAYDIQDIDEEANRVLCLLPTILPYGPRSVSLAELTAFSLDYLDNDNGFFLMVEGANIDKESHSNQTQAMINELIAFNEAVETAMLWATPREDTLIIVTADHETGALYYNTETVTQASIIDGIKWLSGNHSRTRVRIDIYGNVETFVDKYHSLFQELEGRPYWDNTDIFKLAVSYL